jgi:uncharacterized membrane protein YkvA (DUF1232 family)
MLGQMVEPILRNMESVNSRETKQIFAAVLTELNPGWEQKAIGDIAEVSVNIILQTPQLCRSLWNLLNSKETTWAQKTAIAFSLAYLVQPNDFIPDNLPGCFGFVDDVLFLRYSMLCDLKLLPPSVTDEQTERNQLNILSYSIPATARPSVEQMLNVISMRSQNLALVPEYFLQMMCQQVIADPIGSTTPQQQSFTAPQKASASYNPFGGSVSVEGDNTIVSFADGGGCSCIDGNIIGWD